MAAKRRKRGLTTDFPDYTDDGKSRRQKVGKKMETKIFWAPIGVGLG